MTTASFTLGDTSASIGPVDVVLANLASGPAENYLDCNVGRDELNRFSAMIINFRSMWFLLE